ncbi:ferredoxin [Spirochaetia bacterium]|nr:ferredoxin [Spirochaetia bacterium]
MSETFSITFKVSANNSAEIDSAGEIYFQAAAGVTLLEAARQANVAIDAPCSGNGSCGKCLVRVLAGGAEAEKSRHISPESFEEGWRLACQTKVRGNLTVLVPGSAGAFKSRMKIADFADSRERGIFDALKTELDSLGYTGDSGLELTVIHLKKPDSDDPLADRERLLRGLAEKFGINESEVDISLFTLRKLPHVLREGEFSCACVVRREEGKGNLKISILDVFSPDSGVKSQAGNSVLPALAIDIGTTTVAMVLTDLISGELLAMGSEGNGQIRYGADVISRIIESTRKGGLERLRRAVLDDCILPLIRELSSKAGIETSQIYRAALAANTTMTHLFAGVSPEFLRLEPYVPAFFQSKKFRAVDLGLTVNPNAELLLAPSVGSYVGGDISAGVFASLLFLKEKCSLFIDLGTNGELVFGNGEFLMTCACSAGPAFEGGDISCGMRAADGAIEACRIDSDTMIPTLTIIGGSKAAGVCGSGLIDLVGELFTAGIINPKGKFIRQGERIRCDEWGMSSFVIVYGAETESGNDLLLTEGDIDNFIRAKGAIFSAIRTMLAMLDLNMDAIDDVYIAGGIGSGINVERAVRIGMLPSIPAERYHYIGNTSLSGAWAMVQSQKAAEKVDEIAGNMTYLELSAYPGYMDEFIAACFLPHTNGDLFP